MISVARTFETGGESKVAIHTGNSYGIGTGFFFIFAEEGYSFTVLNACLKVVLNTFLLTVV